MLSVGAELVLSVLAALQSCTKVLQHPQASTLLLGVGQSHTCTVLAELDSALEDFCNGSYPSSKINKINT